MSKWLNLAISEEMDSTMAFPLIRMANNYLRGIVTIFQNVLSVGCGDGIELSLFENSTGIDMNEQSLEKARLAGYDVQKMDMHKMTFEDNEFNLVFARDSFEHSISHIEVISEMARVSNQYVCIILPTEDWQYSRWHFIIPTLKQMISLGEKVGLQLKALREYNVILGSISIGQSLYLFEKHK